MKTSRNSEYTRVNPIPKILHFIWIGEPLPEEYLQNILGFMRHNPEHEVKFWTDNIHTFRKKDLSYAQESSLKRLCVESVESIIDNAPKALQKIIVQESVGLYRNFAAASDIIRLLILSKFGGTYLDTDLICLGAIPEQLNKHGFMVSFINGLVINCIISASANNFIIHKALDRIKDKYDEVEEKDREYFPCFLERCKYSIISQKRANIYRDSRRQQTINMTGPGIIASILKDKKINSLEQVGFNYKGSIEMRSDQNWLCKKPRKRSMSI